jgi:hypothetical protein
MHRGKMMILLLGAGVLFLLLACENGLEPVYSSDEPVANSQDRYEVTDYLQSDSESTQIILNGDSIVVTGSGATADGSRVTIMSAGSYAISGSLSDGQIVVDTQDEGVVTLLLNGVDVNSSTSAPIYIANAEEAAIVLADGTENHLSDGASYSVENADGDEPNAAIFSQDDLTILGNGTLTVSGNYNDGIASKDDLTIAGGTIIVNAVDDGIRGKDSLVVAGGNVTVTAQGDGLKADNDADATKGYITIETGVINVTAGGDAIQAQTDVTINGGAITLFTGGGSSNWIGETLSAKGIKGTVSVTITGGDFAIDSADDAIHSNDHIVINDGTFRIASADDGMHADSTLEINGGDFAITRSYEGLESAVITINDGNINITSSDDGINISSGADGSGFMMGGPGGRGGPQQDAFAMSGDYYLYINGGYIVVNAGGDGLDANGSIEMTGGLVIVNGPTENMNGALDCIGTFNVTGGFLVAVGSAGMAEAPDELSSQYSLLLNLDSPLQAGTLVHIQSSDGNDILTFSPVKQFQSVVLSSPELVAGGTYIVSFGGSSSGAASDGLYQGGSYSGGSEYVSFTISNVVTRIGAGGFGGFGGRGGGRPGN